MWKIGKSQKSSKRFGGFASASRMHRSPKGARRKGNKKQTTNSNRHARSWFPSLRRTEKAQNKFFMHDAVQYDTEAYGARTKLSRRFAPKSLRRKAETNTETQIEKRSKKLPFMRQSRNKNKQKNKLSLFKGSTRKQQQQEPEQLQQEQPKNEQQQKGFLFSSFRRKGKQPNLMQSTPLQHSEQSQDSERSQKQKRPFFSLPAIRRKNKLSRKANLQVQQQQPPEQQEEQQHPETQTKKMHKYFPTIRWRNITHTQVESAPTLQQEAEQQQKQQQQQERQQQPETKRHRSRLSFPSFRRKHKTTQQAKPVQQQGNQQLPAKPEQHMQEAQHQKPESEADPSAVSANLPSVHPIQKTQKQQEPQVEPQEENQAAPDDTRAFDGDACHGDACQGQTSCNSEIKAEASPSLKRPRGSKTNAMPPLIHTRQKRPRRKSQQGERDGAQQQPEQQVEQHQLAEPQQQKLQQQQQQQEEQPQEQQQCPEQQQQEKHKHDPESRRGRRQRKKEKNSDKRLRRLDAHRSKRHRWHQIRENMEGDEELQIQEDNKNQHPEVEPHTQQQDECKQKESRQSKIEKHDKDELLSSRENVVLEPQAELQEVQQTKEQCAQPQQHQQQHLQEAETEKIQETQQQETEQTQKQEGVPPAQVAECCLAEAQPEAQCEAGLSDLLLPLTPDCEDLLPFAPAPNPMCDNEPATRSTEKEHAQAEGTAPASSQAVHDSVEETCPPEAGVVPTPLLQEPEPGKDRPASPKEQKTRRSKDKAEENYKEQKQDKKSQRQNSIPDSLPPQEEQLEPPQKEKRGIWKLMRPHSRKGTPPTRHQQAEEVVKHPEPQQEEPARVQSFPIYSPEKPKSGQKKPHKTRRPKRGEFELPIRRVVSEGNVVPKRQEEETPPLAPRCDVSRVLHSVVNTVAEMFSAIRCFATSSLNTLPTSQQENIRSFCDVKDAH